MIKPREHYPSRVGRHVSGIILRLRSLVGGWDPIPIPPKTRMEAGQTDS